MDHSELIAELAYIEKLSTQERLKLARRRRMQQLKKCSQKEREFFSSKKEKTAHNEQKRQKRNNKKIAFACNIMILEAAARNDIDEVRCLLENGVNPDSTNEDGLTALHQCCIDDSEEMMRLLVQYGANVNAKDSEKWTPLHAAATCGHLHLAKFLISKGANLLAVNADGNMPYDICEDDTTLDYIEGEMASRGVTQQLIDDTRAAVEKQMLQDFKKLKAEGKSLMFRDEQGATPLHIASANGYISVVDYLLSQNIPTEVQDNDDWSPIHAAACWGHPDVLELLVQHGGNLQAKTKNQETPYDICEDAELRERISQLINEQETKRLNDQNKRIRRVRSNKRTQSIRRTSVREKTLIPKKDAQEEARMRRHLESKCFSASQGSDIESSDSQTSPFLKGNSEFDVNSANKIINRNVPFMKEFTSEEKKMDFELIDKDLTEKFEREISVSEDFKVQESQDCVPQVDNKDLETDVARVPSVNSSELQLEVKKRDSEPPMPPPRSSSTTLSSSVGSSGTNNNSNNKIDIHVTVTVNPFAPGTLSDLKKQRALSRASQNSFTLSGGSSMFSLNTSQEVESPLEPVPPTCNSVAAFRPPASPSQTPRRFCGEPSDLISKSDRWVCCSLM